MKALDPFLGAIAASGYGEAFKLFYFGLFTVAFAGMLICILAAFFNFFRYAFAAIKRGVFLDSLFNGSIAGKLCPGLFAPWGYGCLPGGP